jgi:hypothetical protein
MRIKYLTAVAVAAFGLAGSAAAYTYVDLGPSTQNYVLYGQGPVAAGIGSFTNQQGDEVYDGVTTTDTLTGTIAGSNDPLFASGTYAFVTTYAGTPIGSGGTQIVSQSNPSDVNYFYYDSFAPSVDMTAYLYTTSDGTVTIPVVQNGVFVGPSFYFNFTGLSCTGVATCGQNNVGLTPGATAYSPTTITLDYGVPEPATWALMTLGLAALGGALRARRTALPSPA